MTDLPELLSPAGDWDCIRAAVAHGADAVYFGLPQFNARMRAENFTTAELPEVLRFLHNHGVKGYVTFNVLVFTDELAAAADQLQLLEAAGVDAVIIQDVGLATLARRITPGLRVHASTQMTVTSPEAVEFALELGVQQVVLARELSIRELRKFDHTRVPLEVFVHGALCVAYSGQCLTSESLGQRSANRGECAQACRMPYELIVDGTLRDLGDRRYLLSPQDLAAVREIPELIQLGIRSFKIEGRLKSPEYVAAVTDVYRKAIDSALANQPAEPTSDDWYRMEMTFSRGLYSGWMHGVNHQELVPARFGKKRGPLAGQVTRTGYDFVEIDGTLPIRAGDGVVFDTGGDTNHESGGRIFSVQGRRLTFGRGRVDLTGIKPGDRVWKTDDPALTRELLASFSGRLPARTHRKIPVDFHVIGAVGGPLVVRATAGVVSVEVTSVQPLVAARNQPLTLARLAGQFGKLDETPFRLGELTADFADDVILPISELNRLRREAIFKLEAQRHPPVASPAVTLAEILSDTTPTTDSTADAAPGLTVLCRDLAQVEAALDANVAGIHVDFEDIRRYRDAVAMVRAARNAPPIHLATPRIQKAGEQGFFKLIANADPDGVLIRNIGAIAFFRDTPLRRIGDFSLNVANPISASVFLERGLDRVTVSYDLTAGQVIALAQGTPPGTLELTIHQHMPMFHMEHCVFAAFLSTGTDHTNCGRPCDTHRVHLRDRVGIDHPLRADVGCRNTLYNATTQTGASHFAALRSAGIRFFRVELLEETAERTTEILTAYRALIDGREDGRDLHRRLHAQAQLGVTRGTY